MKKRMSSKWGAMLAMSWTNLLSMPPSLASGAKSCGATVVANSTAALTMLPEALEWTSFRISDMVWRGPQASRYCCGAYLVMGPCRTSKRPQWSQAASCAMILNRQK